MAVEKLIQRGQIVENNEGDHFIVLDVIGDIVNVESVGTREISTVHISELSHSDKIVLH